MLGPATVAPQPAAFGGHKFVFNLKTFHSSLTFYCLIYGAKRFLFKYWNFPGAALGPHPQSHPLPTQVHPGHLKVRWNFFQLPLVKLGVDLMGFFLIFVFYLASIFFSCSVVILVLIHMQMFSCKLMKSDFYVQISTTLLSLQLDEPCTQLWPFIKRLPYDLQCLPT